MSTSAGMTSPCQLDDALRLLSRNVGCSGLCELHCGHAVPRNLAVACASHFVSVRKHRLRFDMVSADLVRARTDVCYSSFT